RLLATCAIHELSSQRSRALVFHSKPKPPFLLWHSTMHQSTELRLKPGMALFGQQGKFVLHFDPRNDVSLASILPIPGGFLHFPAYRFALHVLRVAAYRQR